jgi:hypothetical protein
VQYRVRPIDFDQQSYEGNYKIYLAQFFSDNFPVVDLVMNRLNQTTIEQYQKEERTLISRRYKVAKRRLDALLGVMAAEHLAPREKLVQLREGLDHYHKTTVFAPCETMGTLVRTHIEHLLDGVG